VADNVNVQVAEFFENGGPSMHVLLSVVFVILQLAAPVLMLHVEVGCT
jgi:hypothetical protein